MAQDHLPLPSGFTELSIPAGFKEVSPAAKREVTALAPADEEAFQQWVKSNKITDVDAPQSFYDYRGYWKANGPKPVQFGVDHFPDTYKQHGHPTFSVESKYSTGPTDGGRWIGERFVPPQPARPSQSDSGALAMQATAKGAVPLAANLAMRFATNPNIPTAASTVARTATTLASPIIGATKYGMPGFVAGSLGAGPEGWIAGRAAYRTARGLQRIAAPVARALEAVQPYLESTIAKGATGAQGALDLAQMADPKRTDIGFLGVGYGDPKADAAYPALLNLLAMKAQDAVAALAASGLSKAEALKSYFTLKQHIAKVAQP